MKLENLFAAFFYRIFLSVSIEYWNWENLNSLASSFGELGMSELFVESLLDPSQRNVIPILTRSCWRWATTRRVFAIKITEPMRDQRECSAADRSRNDPFGDISDRTLESWRHKMYYSVIILLSSIHFSRSTLFNRHIVSDFINKVTKARVES